MTTTEPLGEGLTICLSTEDQYTVQAWMLFPDKDNEYRDAWEKVARSDVDTSLVKLSLDSSRSQSMNDLDRKRSQEGYTIGALIAAWFLSEGQRVHSVEHHRLNTTVQEILKIKTEPNKGGINSVEDTFTAGGEPLSFTSKTYRNYRKKFKRVLHFWAAFAILTNKQGHDGSKINNELYLDGIPSLAEEMLKFTTTYKTPQSSYYLQDAQNSITFKKRQK